MKLELLGDKSFVARSDYDERHIPKDAGFRWNPAQKIWWTDDPKKAAALGQYADATVAEKIKDLLAEKQEVVEASRAVDAGIDIPAPEGLSYLPFQRAGIAYATARPTTIIGDEMGLGKTIQAIGAVNLDPAVSRVLVICPASLRLNWHRELGKWLVRPLSIGIANGKFPETEIVVINYDILKKHRAALRAHEWDMMIVDECHYLKNPKALRTVEVLGKWHSDPAKNLPAIPAKRKIYLTGTPIVNRPIELFPVLKSTGLPEWRNWQYYVTRYCDGRQTRWGWEVNGASNLDKLQEKLRSTVMVRRLKKDVLTDLPAKRRQIIELPANGAAAIVKNERSAWDARQDAIIALQTAVELAKASDDKADYENAVAALRDGVQAAFTEMAKLRHETALAKIPYVVEHIASAVESSGKVVLFAHHKDVIAAVQAALEDAGIKSVKLVGDMGAEARQESVDRFQADPTVAVFIGSIHAAGVGITLTAASHVIFAELDWVPGNISQAEDRCHRIGQTEHVLIQHLALEGSLDADMAKMLVEKQDVIDRALDVKGATIKDATWGSMISVGAVSTRKATRADIETAAGTITDEEAADIHASLRRLSAMCDGAQAIDGMGFNKFDAPIGHSLAAAGTLTKKQAALGKKLVKKYRRQLEG